MPKIVAIDYGKKRTGIATTDDLQIIASGLTTVATEKLIPFLQEFFEREKVEKIVVGLPKKLNNTPSEIESEIVVFIEQFQKHFPLIPVERMDERFTSKIAFQSMIDSGLKKKSRQNKALLDEISATLILQSYLNSR